MTREALLWAAAAVLARDGFAGFDVDMVCAEARVERRLFYRHFQGPKGLLCALRQQPGFWPTAEELINEDAEALKAMPPAELMSEFFKRYLSAMLRRPQTLDVLAWEASQRNDLTRVLEVGRERTALEFFEQMHDDPPEDIDLSALVALVAGAVHFLAVRSRRARIFGGIDLRSERGIERIEKTIDDVFRRTLTGAEGPGQPPSE